MSQPPSNSPQPEHKFERLLADLAEDRKADAEVDTFFDSQEGKDWKESIRARLSAARTPPRRSTMRDFRHALAKCQNVWDVVALLYRYGQELGIRNVRYHRLDHQAQTLVCTACAGMEGTFAEQLRNLGGIVRHYRFLGLRQWDSLWCFSRRRPTLTQVNAAAAPSPLQATVGPSGIPVVTVPADSCPLMSPFKGQTWICVPFKVGDRWAGKASCDVDPEDIHRPEFAQNMKRFWKLVKQAAVYLELFAGKAAQARQDEQNRPLDEHYRAFKELLEDGTADRSAPAQGPLQRYEVTHGALECAAIAAWAVLLLRRYARQSIFIDGGESTLAIARALAHDIEQHGPSVGTIMSNNLGALSTIPAGDKFPTLEATGGSVRRRPGKPGALVPDAALMERLGSWAFAAAVVGTTGIALPHLVTFSGHEHDLKQAAMRSSTDVILPVPGFKWGHLAGRRFLDLRSGFGFGGRLFLITAFPHEDRGAQGYAIRENFLEGMRKLAGYRNLLSYSFALANFHPDDTYPDITPIQDDGAGLARMEAVYARVNPDKRSDHRLLVCLELARCAVERGAAKLQPVGWGNPVDTEDAAAAGVN